MFKIGRINNMFVGCPSGNYAMTGEIIPTVIAIITTLCLIIIAYKLIDLKTKGFWFYAGIFVIVVINAFNLISYNGW